MDFLFLFAFAPGRGFLAAWLRRSRQRTITSELLVLEFVSQGGEDPLDQICIPHRERIRILKRLRQKGLIQAGVGELTLTHEGKLRLEDAFR